MTRVSFKEQVQRVREDAIVGAVNRLLASKGYELMTVDEVAAEAGLSKASLYKHFTSKEELAAAAMVKVLERTLQQVEDQLQASPAASALAQLQELVRWTLRTQLAGEMPSLPAQNSRLVAALKEHRDYMNRLLELSDRLGEWILAAQGSADIDPACRPSWCSTPCLPGPAIPWWACSRLAASTAMRRSWTGSPPPPSAGWPVPRLRLSASRVEAGLARHEKDPPRRVLLGAV